jgi:Skp family chaperone for outer membrane proteins
MRWLAALAVVAGLTGSAVAQEFPTSRIERPVLVIDTGRLFAESAYAKQLNDEIEQVALDIRDENQRIVAELVAEEQSLTELRPTMSPEDFRAAADAFDRKAQDIRAERDAKEIELEEARLDVRVRFLSEVRSVVGQLMVERGGGIVLDSRSAYVYVTAIDITEEAIARVDADFLDAADPPSKTE